MSENVRNVTDAEFEQVVLQSTKPVLVDFWAEWCGPCRALTPILEEVAISHAAQLMVAKVNIDENPTTPSRYGVMSIPTLLLIKDGKTIATKLGLVQKSQLIAFIEAHI